MSYYIGVDGGGTKTQLALFDENRNMIDSVKVAGSNHENLSGSFQEAVDIIMSGLNLLLSANGLKYDDISGTLMGLAGVDHPYQHDALAQIFSERGLERFRIYNDGFIVTKAGLPDGVGIGYNCGTGTCCNSIDSDGNMLQIGGFGSLSDDVGNGEWIARKVFNRIYDEICLGLAHNMMTDIFFQRTEFERSREGLLGSIPMLDDEETAGEMVRLLIDVFFEALNSGDAAAKTICEEMSERGSDYICAHLKFQNFTSETVSVVLSGSMHTKLPADRYIACLEEKCRTKSGGKTLRFIKLDKPPVTGCINWMLEGAE